jgi:hypothetical protein
VSIANLTIVASEIALVVAILGPNAFVGGAAAWALLRSRQEFKDAFQTAEEFYTKAHKSAVQSLSNAVPAFLISQKDRFYRLARLSPRFQFMVRLIDWLERNQAEVNSRPRQHPPA